MARALGITLSEKTVKAFQLHYEIEDRLLEPLEKMLEEYPSAKVIWCHLARICYIERASRYTPAYVDGLIKRHTVLHGQCCLARNSHELANESFERTIKSRAFAVH